MSVRPEVVSRAMANATAEFATRRCRQLIEYLTAVASCSTDRRRRSARQMRGLTREGLGDDSDDH